MREFYGSDKKKIEEGKRKKREEKRLKKLNRKSSPGPVPTGETESPAEPAA